MNKKLIGLLAAAGLALTGCSNGTTKVKIFCNDSHTCSKCEPLANMNLEDYNIISLECESLAIASTGRYTHCHYILTYRE